MLVFHNVHECYTHIVAKYSNGHVGEGNRGDNKIMGRYGDKARNAERQMVVDFAIIMEMAVVNTYFKKEGGEQGDL